MRVHVVDPSAYTPPYDHALCRALGAAGAGVTLYTSRFAYGSVPAAEDYERREHFYRLAHRAAAEGPSSRARRALKLAEHVPDMLRYRREAQTADVAHFQWLTAQPLDVHLLPRRTVRPPAPGGDPRHGAAPGRTAAGGPALVLTAHDILPREPRPGQLAAQRRLYGHFDAIVVHSERGRGRLLEELGVDPTKVHSIPHGALTHLAELPVGPPPHEAPGLVVLCFGLMRPYKGIDVLLEAWRGLGGAAPGPELWIAGMPRMDISALRAAAPANVRFDARFIPDAELPAYFARADLLVLPYLQADQSGVLFTALAFGKPLLLSDVGGFPEIARTGAARAVPAGDSEALAEALRELLADPTARAEMAARARAAAAGPYSWQQVARAHLRLYEGLLES
ncbi:MAG TPA: glycosyltransferase family 4 protein [Solirubrobacteraceae bacterium]|jgi:glycosyltransferase involved in cell wall biosynthesis|nr:glycosyltransferase family 4 protein [Solirubrobacteraceae bacterium]